MCLTIEDKRMKALESLKEHRILNRIRYKGINKQKRYIPNRNQWDEQ